MVSQENIRNIAIIAHVDLVGASFISFVSV